MLGGTLSTSPAQFTASIMFVNKTKTTLRAHTVDKNTSSVCRSKRRFRHAPVLFLSIYRDTVPLNDVITPTAIDVIRQITGSKFIKQEVKACFVHRKGSKAWE